MNKIRPCVTNCEIYLRKGDSALFTATDNEIVPNLDGYTIVPKEMVTDAMRAEFRSHGGMI
jgi:hypothetical protein